MSNSTNSNSGQSYTPPANSGNVIIAAAEAAGAAWGRRYVEGFVSGIEGLPNAVADFVNSHLP